MLLVISWQEDIANSIFAEADAEPVRPSTLSKDYKMVLNRYMQSNGPRSLPAMTDNELDRKYGQVLTRCQSITLLYMSLVLLT